MISFRWSSPRRRIGVVARLIPLLAAPLFCAPAGGQTPPTTSGVSPTPPTGILRIRSEPPGAVVRLLGDHRWSGTTPWDLQRGIEGTYRIVARMDGYEDWRRTVEIARGETRDLDIRLTPKAAWKAGLRSIIFPGWGQFYAEKHAKGTVFAVGTVALAGALLWTNEEYRDRTDDYRAARRVYMDATTLADLDRLRADSDRARARADRAYDRRQASLYAAAGLYAAAILDAVLLFPGASEGNFASVAPWGDRGPQFSVGAPRGDLAVCVSWTGWEGGAR
jgi:hypothetical protein